MRCSTSSRVHVNPSVRMMYMSGAASKLECSPMAETSCFGPPLPVPSAPKLVAGTRVEETSLRFPSSWNPAPS